MPTISAPSEAAESAAALAKRVLADEWFGSGPHRAWLQRQARPAPSLSGWSPLVGGGDPAHGARLLAGDFRFADAAMTLGVSGDPWDRPSPSRDFALALHRFDWLEDLLATGEAGRRRAQILLLDWGREFGAWNDFSWSGEIIEARLVTLAPRLARVFGGAAAPLEPLAVSLARQGFHLLSVPGASDRAAERAAAAAMAGCALRGPVAERLRHGALQRLQAALGEALRPDGLHASRCADRSLVLYERLTLLAQALETAPIWLATSLGGMAKALGALTLADGALPALQGARARPSPVAARAVEGIGGYQRLAAGGLDLLVDAVPPVHGPFSLAACDAALALEIVADGQRLVTAAASGRGPSGGSTVSLDQEEAPVLSGRPARELGERLTGGARRVQVERHVQGEDVWLDLTSDALAGLSHHRRLYLAPDELRGEDRLERKGAGGETTFTLRFHLHPAVEAVLEGRGVVLRAPRGSWRLISDAPAATLEADHAFDRGEAVPSRQLVLRAPLTAEGGRVRWKLGRA